MFKWIALRQFHDGVSFISFITKKKTLQSYFAQKWIIMNVILAFEILSIENNEKKKRKNRTRGDNNAAYFIIVSRLLLQFRLCWDQSEKENYY